MSDYRTEAIRRIYDEERGQAREDIGWMLDRIAWLETGLREIVHIADTYRPMHVRASVIKRARAALEGSAEDSEFPNKRRPPGLET